MKLAVLIVFLGLVLCGVRLPAEQASKPKVPSHDGVAKGNSGQQGREGSKIQQGQRFATPEVSTSNPASPQQHKSNTEQFNENFQIQGKLVTATVALVVVGILQAGVLVWQAIALSRTLKAIKDNAEAYMVSQRAQLIALVRTGTHLFSDGRKPFIPLDIRNNGPTPAYHCMYETWIEVIDVPFQDFSQGADYYKAPFPMTIYPNSPAPTTIHIGLQRALTDAEFADFSEGNKSLCFRIRIEYQDAFKGQRWCEFGCEFTGERVGALPKYNDSN
jgi:hypothetical protein